MFITGPAGKIEADLALANIEKPVTAILCHPHPLYGGSMHDMVLDTVAGVLLAQGANCLRFNFRGVGASEGAHDDGNGEVDDLLAAIEWVTDEYPRDKLWLAGYSFGASIVWKTAAHVEPDLALLVAPPIGPMPFPARSKPTRTYAFAGDRDDFVDLTKLEALEGVESHIIPGADHFFMGHHDTLAEQISAVFSF